MADAILAACRRAGGFAVGYDRLQMLEAFVVGAIAQSSLLLSGLLVYFVTLPGRVIGQLAGFGAGALLGAAAFQLAPDSETLASAEIALWALVGGGVYVVADRVIEARLGRGGGSNSLGIVVGNINDALPESLIFGIQLGTGLVLSLPFVAAVWISNIPQALPPSADLAKSGWKMGRLLLMWGVVVLLAGAFSAVGFALPQGLADVNGARVAAFTIGGLITMLMTSMIPFAYEKGGVAGGIWATVGFVIQLAAN
jgi:ZIP family zinc transporter